MHRVRLPGLTPASIAARVGRDTYIRGMELATAKSVLQTWWEPDENALCGIVRGSTGKFYTTTAHFSGLLARLPEFDHGLCNCPVGFNCKHVVALVLSAADRPEASVAGAGGQGSRAEWERSLDSLAEPGHETAAARSNPPSLAIEVSLAPDLSYGRPRFVSGSLASGRAPSPDAGPPPRLVARLVRPGKNGGWVAGSLNWSKLENLRHQGGYPRAQLRLLQEMYALFRFAGSSLSYYYGGDDRTIELSAFESRQLWPLLDEAHSAGLRLVYPRKLGEMDRYRSADLCLDVTSGGEPGSLSVTPVLRIDDAAADVTPIRFIGTDGHGIVYADRSEAARTSDRSAWRFQLARLAQPAAAQLQNLALAGRSLDIPAAARDRFRDVYFPRLRHSATLVSSDGAFTPPAISGPTLVLNASYGDGHQVDIGWEWAYQVGDSRLRVPVDDDAGGAGYRDAAAERDLLAGLDLPLERFGLAGPAAARGAGEQHGSALPPRLELSGIDTMRFSTELLPLLADQPGVSVDITGDPADYREASESVRIAVSADQIAGETDWFDLGVTITVDGQNVPFADVFVALSRGEPYLLLDDGAYFSLCKPELQALARLIEEAQGLTEWPDERLAISRYQAGLWRELTELGVVSHQSRRWRQQVDGLLSAGTVSHPEPPATLTAQLRPYQLDGFGWLAFLWKHQLGGILADDMGLGKTLQTLALICHAKQAEPGLAPFLIVAPTSVVPNWAAEAARFTPGLRVVSVSDTLARRGRDIADLVSGADVVVTSYTLLRIDFDAYASQAWSGLILDEAQFTKNHQSKIYQCARRLPARFKVAITGTPMENNLMELWSLLSITAPGLFPDPERFREYYARPIERQGDPELLAQLRRRIKPLVKRRTKEQVAADLPAKQEQVLEVELHPRHRKVYQTHLQRERQKVLGLIDDMNAHRFTILRSLTLLRQLSLHAGLVDEAYADLASSKIDALHDQLDEVIGGGHRALVFSQFTGFLRLVRERLDAAGIGYCYLDGSTRKRADVLREFTDGHVPVFLISLKAGGFGLNLTEADYCFLLDPWWNPATEAQAIDRTHRIGQTRNVMVYRLIAKDTIEEKVMALKARKAELFTSVLDDGNVFGASLDADDIRGLFE